MKLKNIAYARLKGSKYVEGRSFIYLLPFQKKSSLPLFCYADKCDASDA